MISVQVLEGGDGLDSGSQSRQFYILWLIFHWYLAVLSLPNFLFWVIGNVVYSCLYIKLHALLYTVKVIMSTASESSPLLSKPLLKENSQKHCSCHVKYRLPKFTEKGAIVMIVCNVPALTARCARVQKMYSTIVTCVAFTIMAIITFPIVGIVADTCVGRFNVMQASISYSTMVSALRNIF